MRVSTSNMYNTLTATLVQQQSDLFKTQQQISTGRKILTPSDDPINSAQILQVTQSLELVQQNDANAIAAKAALNSEESVLASVTRLIQDVKTLAVNAGNATMRDGDRAMLATELQTRYDELLGLANSKDENGNYLFSGFKGTTVPFTQTVPGTVAYNGDQGQRLLRLAPSRQVAISDSGVDVFQRIRNGNGTFVTAAAAANTGSGVIGPGVVTSNANWVASAQDYQIVFKLDSTTNPAVPVMKYDILNSAGTLSMITGLAPAAVAPMTYTNGQDIPFSGLAVPAPGADYGIKMPVSGTPVNGDTFTVKASTSQDLFTTLNNMITALQTSVPTTGTGGNAKLINDLNANMSNLDNALDNVLNLRAVVGAHLKEIDNLQSSGEDTILQYQARITDMQSLDYAQAVSDLTLQKTNLEAAQLAYTKISGLSLFNYLV